MHVELHKQCENKCLVYLQTYDYIRLIRLMLKQSRNLNSSIKNKNVEINQQNYHLINNIF